MIAASGDGTVDSCRFDPTPQYKHKRISWVAHSSLAAPCEQGWDAVDGEMGGLLMSFETTLKFIK